MWATKTAKVNSEGAMGNILPVIVSCVNDWITDGDMHVVLIIHSKGRVDRGVRVRVKAVSGKIALRARPNAVVFQNCGMAGTKGIKEIREIRFHAEITGTFRKDSACQ